MLIQIHRKKLFEKNWGECGPGHRTLKLAVCQERINGINWDTNSKKLKVTVIVIGRLWSKIGMVKNWHGLLKVLSQVWDNFW